MSIENSSLLESISSQNGKSDPQNSSYNSYSYYNQNRSPLKGIICLDTTVKTCVPIVDQFPSPSYHDDKRKRSGSGCQISPRSQNNSQTSGQDVSSNCYVQQVSPNRGQSHIQSLPTEPQCNYFHTQYIQHISNDHFNYETPHILSHNHFDSLELMSNAENSEYLTISQNEDLDLSCFDYEETDEILLSASLKKDYNEMNASPRSDQVESNITECGRGKYRKELFAPYGPDRENHLKHCTSFKSTSSRFPNVKCNLTDSDPTISELEITATRLQPVPGHPYLFFDPMHPSLHM